jgi:hypothetical protein
MQQEQPRPYAVEGIAAIPGRSAVVGDLNIGESNEVMRRGSTWRVRQRTAVILSGGSFRLRDKVREPAVEGESAFSQSRLQVPGRLIVEGKRQRGTATNAATKNLNFITS